MPNSVDFGPQRSFLPRRMDLDLEAPGLSAVPNLTPIPEHGIVDYFYERSYIPQGVEPSISIVEMFGEMHIPNAPE